MTSLLFARGTDCVLVGDSDGQVNVYQLKNLSVGEGKQVKVIFFIRPVAKHLKYASTCVYSLIYFLFIWRRLQRIYAP